MKRIKTETLWNELVKRHEDGECIQSSMPDYIDDLAIEHFGKDIYDFDDDEIIDEFNDRRLEINEVADDEDMIKDLFEIEGIAQYDFAKQKVEEIKDLLRSYSYLSKVG